MNMEVICHLYDNLKFKKFRILTKSGTLSVDLRQFTEVRFLSFFKNEVMNRQCYYEKIHL